MSIVVVSPAWPAPSCLYSRSRDLEFVAHWLNRTVITNQPGLGSSKLGC